MSEIAQLLPEPGEPFALGGGRARCCDEDYGGSHYHCGGGCGAVTSMYGHFVTVKEPKANEPSWLASMPARRLSLPVGYQDHWCKAVLALVSFMHGATVHFGRTGPDA